MDFDPKKHLDVSNIYDLCLLSAIEDNSYFVYELLKKIENKVISDRLICTSYFNPDSYSLNLFHSGIVSYECEGLVYVNTPSKLFSRYNQLIADLIHTIYKKEESFSILFCGLGVGAIQGYVSSMFSSAAISTIEINEQIIQLYKDHINHDIGSIICDNAKNFLHKTDQIYDIIVIDIHDIDQIGKLPRDLDFFHAALLKSQHLILHADSDVVEEFRNPVKCKIIPVEKSESHVFGNKRAIMHLEKSFF